VRQRLIYLGLAVAAIAIGLLFRTPALHLPWTVGKYGGSILWAEMVYFILRAILPNHRAGIVALIAAVLAALGECTQLISVPWFDALRDTTIGHLIFGRTFAVEDIVAYWIGILAAAVLDAFMRRPVAPSAGQ
jgi:membrane-associated PAP2 superfamily phosphatase